MSTLTAELRLQAFATALEIDEQLAELTTLRERALAAFEERAARLRATRDNLYQAAVSGQGGGEGPPAEPSKPKRPRARKQQPAQPPPVETGEKRVSPEASARTATAPQAEAPVVAPTPVLEVPAPRVPCANCACGHSVAEHTAPDAVTLQRCRTPGCSCETFELGEVYEWKVSWGNGWGGFASQRVFWLTRRDESTGVVASHGPLLLEDGVLVRPKSEEGARLEVVALTRRKGHWGKEGDNVPLRVLELVERVLAQQAQTAPAAPAAEKSTRQRKAKAAPPASPTQVAETSAPAQPQAEQARKDDNAPLPGQLELGTASVPSDSSPSERGAALLALWAETGDAADKEVATPEPVSAPQPVGTEVEGWRVELSHVAERLTCAWLVNATTKEKHAATWFGGAVGELSPGHPGKKSADQQLTTQEAEARSFFRYRANTVVAPLTEACRQGKVPGLLLSAPKSGASSPYAYALSGGWRLLVYKPRENEPHVSFAAPTGEVAGRFRLDGQYLLGSGVDEAEWVAAHEALVREAEDLVARGFVPELKTRPAS